jgi:hypothetical protein
VYEKRYTHPSYYLNGESYQGINWICEWITEFRTFSPIIRFRYNPKGLLDNNKSYFERNRSHVLIHIADAIDNPKKLAGY